MFRHIPIHLEELQQEAASDYLHPVIFTAFFAGITINQPVPFTKHMHHHDDLLLA